MINRIIEFSIKNKLVVGFFTIAMIVGGIWSMRQIPLDAVPDVTNNQIQVITLAPNLGTEDIEQLVTYPVELAMANLPEVQDIRSVSRFGLSLVTVVFNESAGTYLPRQLVAEKLVEIKEEIPAELGEPFMGPISTGLGEIYQYTIKVDSNHRSKYSISDLRSIQDWMIKRQMAMVKGVVEVNAIGGESKQYEVAVDPDRIKSMGIGLLELYTALQNNNENTGGAYIEKNRQAHFIRSEGMVKTLDDIENIVVKNVNGIPVLIKDVAKVKFGAEVRYGAVTKNGEGEAVGGMIMMLKGENSNEVITRVKTRMAEIETTLPEGLSIEPLIDRSVLIKNTTGTVTNNLMEGALIVIFVLIFLLGNWRGGLIVASTIPISLLFAFILMNAFGVWANLMSLGAIDFGIIVDGAVIIVEGTVFMLMNTLLKNTEFTKKIRNQIAQKASSKMMNAAFFGQLIILIVFIPILSLEGIEGKMFKPMALTFMFAMLGVMLLCLTYVPMMSAWLLRPTKDYKLNWGDRLVKWIQEKYEPVLKRSLRSSKLIIAIAAGLLALSVFIFSRQGGEFVPQLDENDIAFHAIVKPGSALSETIATTTAVEKIVKENFPEVITIVSKIGVADVPTDPMPMDVADVMVAMKPKSEWVSATSKEELIHKMKEAVGQVPGVNFEFSQPIEMRFNELIEGVREDIAIMVYGEDMNVLSQKADKIVTLINGVDGVGDIKAESVKGLPQMTVNYNRQKIAQYGVSIEQLNTLVSTAFAGANAGKVFEGEKRFNLVVRFDSAYRGSIQDLKGLFVDLPDGSSIPINELADIKYTPGLMQISRDNTNRRTYVGINVRGRDVKSLVSDIQEILDANLDLPPGYYIRYGGAFENLERATKRLSLLVPLTLLLIFVLIFLALRSIQQSLLIFMAIPLAAIGGVLALYLRDMPFSISAGIGFIVLFGVAVLNGLVLISSWSQLKEEGMDLQDRIQEGAKRRIRPILLTALTDILGFLPMAISTSAGAEVQRPLATVVIGGMITATLLTLFVLPILYKWMETRKRFKWSRVTTVILVLMAAHTSWAQSTINTAEDAVEIALSNNLEYKSAELNMLKSSRQEGTAWNLSPMALSSQYGQYNSVENDLSWSVSQNFGNPLFYRNRLRVLQQMTGQSEIQMQIKAAALRRDVKLTWNELVYLRSIQLTLDIRQEFLKQGLKQIQKRFELGQVDRSAVATAQLALLRADNNLLNSKLRLDIQKERLYALMNDSSRRTIMLPRLNKMNPIVLDSTALQSSLLYRQLNSKAAVVKGITAVEKSNLLPQVTLGYTNLSMTGTELNNGQLASGSDRFGVVKAGISLPLVYGNHRSRIRVAQFNEQITTVEHSQQRLLLDQELQILLLKIDQMNQMLDNYEAIDGEVEALSDAEFAKLKAGSTDIIMVYYNIENALDMSLTHLEALRVYNIAVINLEHLVTK